MIETLDQLDRSLFLYLNGKHTEWLDPIMWFVSEPLTWIPVYLIFLYLGYKKYGPKGILWLLIGAGLVVLFADNIHRECFKYVFKRLRPSQNPELEGLVHGVIKPTTGKLYKGGLYGFISGHASNFVGLSVFMILFLELKRYWKYLVLFWALLICYSRIYLGVHYPGDILGGIILGVSIGFLISFLVKRYLIKTG